jgi:nitroreductase
VIRAHNNLTHEQRIAAVDQAIRERKTAKLLRDPAGCASDPLPSADFMQAVYACVEVAGWAPFHKLAHKEVHLSGSLTSPVPWRFYVLEKPMCCGVVEHLRQQAAALPETKWSKAWGSKIPKLLAGAGAAILVTWLPDPPASGEVLELTDNNMEHIAATAAAVQNVLLAAEARGMFSYWSSGGILGDVDVFDWLTIPRNQKLLAAIFLSSADAVYDALEPGGLREKRGSVADWSLTLRNEE